MKCPICNQKIDKNNKNVVKGPEIMDLWGESSDKILLHRLCSNERKRDLKTKLNNLQKILKNKMVDYLNGAKTFPIIELFGHETYHEDAQLIMNEKGRKLLMKALKTKVDIVTINPFVRDGEGYALRVMILPTKKIDLMQEPYLHDWVNRETVPHPSDVATYKDLIENKKSRRLG